jgi:hypothetical protein
MTRVLFPSKIIKPKCSAEQCRSAGITSTVKQVNFEASKTGLDTTELETFSCVQGRLEVNLGLLPLSEVLIRVSAQGPAERRLIVSDEKWFRKNPLAYHKGALQFSRVPRIERRVFHVKCRVTINKNGIGHSVRRRNEYYRNENYIHRGDTSSQRSTYFLINELAAPRTSTTQR